MLVENCDFFHTTPAFDVLIPIGLCHVWHGKTRMAWLANGEKTLRICILVSTR